MSDNSRLSSKSDKKRTSEGGHQASHDSTQGVTRIYSYCPGSSQAVDLQLQKGM